MNMKFFVLFALFGSVASLSAAPEKAPQIVVEPDQTDIYAIPLDEDADEQQQELESLEHPSKK